MKTTRLLVTLIALLGVWQCMFAENQAYAVLDDNGLLTFYYDENKSSRTGSKFNLPWSGEPEWWNYYRNSITTVTFDESFSSYRLESAANMFNLCSNLTSIDFTNFNTENVSNMSGMFYNCTNLTSLDLSNFDTSNVTNMLEMFSECSGLETLTLPQNINTEKVTSMQSMFLRCKNLSSLDLSSFDTGNVTDMIYMFSGCEKLMSLDLSSFDTSKVTQMYNMFDNCKLLATLTFSDGFDTSNVTDMHEMFSNCESLNNLVLSSFNTSNVTNMLYMFNGCKSLTSLNLSNFDTSKVENMSSMFEECSGLSSLDLSSFDTSSNRYFTKMFYKCTTLTHLDIRNFNLTSNSFASSMFEECSNLMEILCTNTWYVSSNNSSNMFLNCNSIIGGKGTTFGDGNPNDNEYAHPDGGPSNPGYFTEGKPYAILSEGTLTFYYDLDMMTRTGTKFSLPTNDNAPRWTVPEFASTITTVTFDASFSKNTLLSSIKSYFSGLSNLTTINDIHNLPTSNVTDMSEMFKGCNHLTSLDVSSFDVTNVTDMTEMFYDCSSLETIYCHKNWANGVVSSSENMFAGCEGFPNFDPDEVTVTMANPNDGYFSLKKEAYVYIEYYDTDKVQLTFYYDKNMYNYDEDCVYPLNEDFPFSGIFDNSEWYDIIYNTRLVEFNSSFIEYKPTSTAQWFNGMPYLESISGIEYLNTEDVENMSGMFAGCGKLMSIDLSNFNTLKVTDMSFMFSDCSDLKKLDLSNFNTSIVTDMSSMFQGCNSLTSLDLSNFETSKVVNMSSMFQGCTSLTSVDLSNFDTSIVTDMSSMFSDCKNLEMIYAGNWYDIEREEGIDSDYMFADCRNLPGYDENYYYYYDIAWAKPTDDEGVGFFSTRRVYAIVEDDNLSFHYDGKNTDKTTYDIDWTIEDSWKNATQETFENENFVVTFDPSFADYKLTSTAGLFSEMVGLTIIYGLDNLNTSSITDMRNMFNGCSGLTTIYCGKDWSGLNVTSSDGMFAGCTNLVGAISYDSNKTDIKYANPYDGYFSQLPQAYAVQEGSVLTFYYDNKINTHSDAIIYEIPWEAGGIEGGEEGSGGGYPGWIGYDGGGYAPARKSAKAKTAYEPITRAVFDPSFKNYHGLNSTANMFYRMGSLTSIEGLEYLNTENVTTMQSMFEGCSSLTSLDLTSFNTEKVSTMQAMFAECSSLTSLNLSNFNTYNVGVLYDMFNGCNSLTTLDLTNFDMTNVTDVDEVFFNCTSLETIFCNDDWSSKSYEYSSDIFWNCVSLKGSNGTDLEYFLNDDEPSYISYARPDEGPDAPGFFTPLSEGKIIMYDSSTNTNTISNNNNKTVDVYFCERKLYKDGDWNTLCLPFNVNDADANDELTFSGTPLEGATVMTLSQNGTGFSDGELSLNFVTATTIEAGKPYIVKWGDPEDYDEYEETEVIINPTFTNVTIQNVQESQMKVETEYVDFVGNFNPFTIGAAGDKTKLYLGARNGLYYPNGASTFYGFRAYFQLKGDLTAGEGEGASQIKAINLHFGDEENGIFLMEDGRSKMEDAWYSLDGRRLLEKPTQKGMYIHNGRKVMIK